MAPHIELGRVRSDEHLRISFRPPHRGDIVAFRHDDGTRELFIKRVVGRAGRSRPHRSWRRLSQRHTVDEPYVRLPRRAQLSRSDRAAGSVYVLGDNRADSEDSRFFGPVSDDRLIGRARGRRLAARVGRRAVRADLERVIQWYPGHMVRAMRKIGEYLRLIDVVVEVVDARRFAQRRAIRCGRTRGPPRASSWLNRDDLADPQTTKRWIEHFAARGIRGGRRRRTRAAERLARSPPRCATSPKETAARRSRVIVVGIPNSGKSSIINGLRKRSAAKTEDRAGVTRQLQWFRLTPNIELMDTPGILVPKIATKSAQWKLALTGAVPRTHYDPEEVSERVPQVGRRAESAHLGAGSRNVRVHAVHAARRRGRPPQRRAIVYPRAQRRHVRALSFESPHDE